MRGRIILTVFWVFSLMLAGGDAQIRAHKQRPVWTMEVIKVKAGELGDSGLLRLPLESRSRRGQT